MLNRRTLFTGLLSASAVAASKRPENTEPFVACSIDDNPRHPEFSQGLAGLPKSADEMRIYVNGKPLPEVQWFDTRSKTLGFVLFDRIPSPIQEAFNKERKFPEIDPELWLRQLKPDDAVQEGVFKGPFTVAWIHSTLGILTTFNVEYKLSPEEIISIKSLKVK